MCSTDTDQDTASQRAQPYMHSLHAHYEQNCTETTFKVEMKNILMQIPKKYHEIKYCNTIKFSKPMDKHQYMKKVWLSLKWN